MLNSNINTMSLIDVHEASIIATLAEDFQQDKISKFNVIKTLKKIKEKGFLNKGMSFKTLFNSKLLTSPSSQMMIEDIARVLQCGRTDINFAKYGYLMLDPNDIQKYKQDKYRVNVKKDLRAFNTAITLSKEIQECMLDSTKLLDNITPNNKYLYCSSEDRELKVLLYNLGIANTINLFKLLCYIEVISKEDMEKISTIQ